MSREGTRKNASLAAGIGVLLAILVAITLSWGERSFTAHMVVHMAIVAIAAPLVATALSGSRADLTRHLPWLGPLLASLIELVIVWIWHVPAMRGAVEAEPFLGLFEQATFLAGGLLLWLTCLGGAADGRTGRRLAGAIGLLFTSMHMTLLGVLLALSPRPLYGDGDATCFGIPLTGGTDQQLGGVVMLAVGAASYLIGGVALLSGILRDEGPLKPEDAQC
ncbi:cytochrome C oxidase [Rhizobium sp. Leaf371]|uniref:cytochrome c oxidase assembly protein n=1 Tax=Rhizobium sp. Leaf371 TaxID=1736355 RepID=UPI00071326BA|nr:cytochrome c oxidase assembly protein [Rhizobium sp. Leaf371]KQS71451.1 cytochrome C oxidase [Rhizobium sp. Leaf371]